MQDKDRRLQTLNGPQEADLRPSEGKSDRLDQENEI